MSDQSPKAQGEGVGSEEKQPKNPMRPTNWRMHLSLAQSCPRCGAQTRSGKRCRQAAMPNGRCRMHGGSSTGPTAAGIERIREARTIHGGRSAEMLELRREMAMLKRAARGTIAAVW